MRAEEQDLAALAEQALFEAEEDAAEDAGPSLLGAIHAGRVAHATSTQRHASPFAHCVYQFVADASSADFEMLPTVAS